MGMTQDEDNVSDYDSKDDLPSPEDCITHLKLMTAFSYLRDEITESRDLFLNQGDLTDTLKADIQSKLVEKRWTIYVSRAVRRFEQWVISLTMRHKEKVSDGSLSKEVSSISGLHDLQDQTETSTWSADDLPPLDVLLVFHAYMLNPRWFLDDCLRLKWMYLWKAGMPWRLLVQYIDADSFEYNVPESTKTAFAKRTGFHWNNLDDSESQLLLCSICSNQNNKMEQTSTSEWLQYQEFSLLCTLPCRNLKHLQQIQADNLRSDLEAFHAQERPLRATFLNHRGRIPEKETDKRPPRNFAARLLSDKVVKARLEPQARSKEVADDVVASAFDEAHKMIQSSGFSVRKIKSDRMSSQISFAEQYSLSRTRISYSEFNGQPFSIDLAAAVLRQGKFVNDMRDIAWIFSPNLLRTVENLLGKYEAFLDVMADSARDQISVPTLAVDLAWHTHQLSPPKYFRYCIAEVNELFVDHDDRVGEGDLEVAFKRTSEKFKEMTGGGNYGECMCWHCAALDLHAREMSPNSKLNTSGETKSDLERRKEVEQRAADTVREFQRRKFDHDYERHQRNNNTARQVTDVLTSPDRILFSQNYKWPYPNYVPANKA